MHVFLVHHIGDSVGVAVEDLGAGDVIDGRYLDSEETAQVEPRAAIPLGHKIALKDIPQGAQVVEYGVPIGAATEEIRTGDHVHVHNLRSIRWIDPNTRVAEEGGRR